MIAHSFSHPDSGDQVQQDARSTVLHLQKSELFRTYQKAFETATGLPLVIRRPGSFEPPLQGSRRVNLFCGLMMAANKTCAACLCCQQRVEDGARHGAFSTECHAGLAESAVPVLVDGNVIAYLQTGQVRLRPRLSPRPHGTTLPWDLAGAPAVAAKLKAAYATVRVMPRPQYDSTLRLLATFAHHLSVLSGRLMLQQASAESPVAARMRQFIADHHGEEISLAQTAAAMNMSAFYFCKMFRKLTGMNFTGYLAKMRINMVIHQLLNPSVRISEAAFAAGFQSLSQFNRTFRRITGESPRHYRRRLAGNGTGHDERGVRFSPAAA